MAYSKYNRKRFEGEKPVKEGESYDVQIEATGTKGDGIAKVKGFVVIIPGAKEGQNVKVKIDAVRGKVAFGTLVGAAEPKKAQEKEQESSEEAGESAPEEEPKDEGQEDSSEEEDSGDEASSEESGGNLEDSSEESPEEDAGEEAQEGEEEES